MGISTEKQKIGKIGEDLACKFLVKQGYSVIDRNYLKVFGEIDIICKRDNILHFVEVKTVSRKTTSFTGDVFRPEDNVHAHKLVRIGRTIEAYLFEHPSSNEWMFDVITVQLNQYTKEATISMLADLII